MGQGLQSLPALCCCIFLAASAACALRKRQPAVQSNQHFYQYHSASTDAAASEPTYSLYDATAAQDIGMSQTAAGRHQELNTFWLPHLQRAARSELALKMHMAARQAEREQNASWHQHMGHQQRHRSPQDPVVIAGSGMFWPELFGRAQDLGPEACEVPCRWVVDAAEAERADVASGMASYSAGEIRGVQRRHPGQTIALFSMEPIWGLTARDMDPHLQHWDMMATVSAHSDAPVGYADTLRDFLEGEQQAAFEAEHPLPEEWLSGPKGMMATFITSGCGKDPDDDWGSEYTARNRLIRDLAAEGIAMDHYGGCKFGREAASAKLPTAEVPGASGGYGSIMGQRRKVQLMKAYRFALGAENTVQVDYITEKFWQLFGSRQLPVYLGAPNAGAYAPPHSFVNVLEHTPKQLARLLRHLHSNQEDYNSYFRYGEGNLTALFRKALSEHVMFGEQKDGMGWVCQLCRTHHKYYDYVDIRQ